jgi:hypothetical protein
MPANRPPTAGAIASSRAAREIVLRHDQPSRVRRVVSSTAPLRRWGVELERDRCRECSGLSHFAGGACAQAPRFGAGRRSHGRPPRAAAVRVVVRKNVRPPIRTPWSVGRASAPRGRSRHHPAVAGGGLVAVPPRRDQASPSRSAAGGTATRLRVKVASARGDRRGARELERSSLRLGGDGVVRQETRKSGSLPALVLLVAVGPS